jgi:hypothetical protein
MKHLVAVTALAVTLAHPASAITFPTLTTIYVGTGIIDHLTAATMFHCANVSGGTVSLRILLLGRAGEFVASHNVAYSHGQSYGVGTRNIALYAENFVFTGPGITEGTVNIESTNSAVFCSAKVVDPAAGVPTGYSVPLIRVNPHPGTVE